MSIRLLEHMRDELINSGIVQNTPEFCRSWLGRSEGYIRVLRYNRIEPSVETLAICSNKLSHYAARLSGSEIEHHKQWAAKYKITATMTYEEAKMELAKIDTKDDTEISYHTIEQI